MLERRMTMLITFNIKLPITYECNGSTVEITRDCPGRFGLRINGEGITNSPNLHDIYDTLQRWGLDMPEGSVTKYEYVTVRR
jgi:hypothetical protein